MLNNIIDRVATTMTNVIVVSTTITTTFLVPFFMYKGVRYFMDSNMINTVMCLVSVYLLVQINKSIQGGH